MKTRILSAVVALPLLLFIVISGGICWRIKKVYSKPASVSKTISGPRITVGNRWLATFQQSAPTHEQSTAIATIRLINTSGRGPKGKEKSGVCIFSQ